MSETEKTEIVRTPVFSGKVKVALNPEATEARGKRNTAIDLEIEAIKVKMQPDKEAITVRRAEKRKLIKEISAGYAEETRDIYELKDFVHRTADQYDATTDEKISQRTLDPKDYQADLEERPEADA